MLEAGLKVRPSNARDETDRSARGSKQDRALTASPPLDARGLIETSGFGFEDVEGHSLSSDAYPPSARPGTSRIPVSKHSPAPLANSYTERGSPIGRWSDSNSLNSAKKLRPRSQSLGSEAILDGNSNTTPDKARPASSHLVDSPVLSESSDSAALPTLRITPRKASSGTRTGSASKKTVISNGSTKDSPDPRPKSRARPRSVHRPEGEAPWIATMYKPDPMLPPDQQILPTHAKKMLQEQMARENSPGDGYDRNLTSGPGTAQDMHMSPLLHPTSHLPPRSPPPTSPLPELPGSTPTSRQGSSAGAYRGTPTVTPSPSPGPRHAPTGRARRSSLRAQRDRDSKTHPPVPRRASVRDPGDDDIELRNGAMVHRLDPQRLTPKDNGPEADDEGGGCCKCVVM